jgi:hypothetical protein
MRLENLNYNSYLDHLLTSWNVKEIKGKWHLTVQFSRPLWQHRSEHGQWCVQNIKEYIWKSVQVDKIELSPHFVADCWVCMAAINSTRVSCWVTYSSIKSNKTNVTVLRQLLLGAGKWHLRSTLSVNALCIRRIRKLRGYVQGETYEVARNEEHLQNSDTLTTGI